MRFASRARLGVFVAMSHAVALGAGHAAEPQPAPPPIVQPGAPGERTREITASAATDISGVHHTEADVRFMQGMIGHHAQALEMTALLSSRTTRADLRALARRIEVSQADEIAMMTTWLTRRGAPVPDMHADHAHEAARMPGMLSAAEMQRLRDARGAAFDRLFLESMIQHHEGALTMVRELFAAPQAGQEPEMFAFVSDVEADQGMEIGRMRALLKELP